MNIQKFEYIYNEYATTNPPRSVCNAYTLEDFNDESVSLVYYTSYNGNSNEIKLRITEPEYSKIIGYLENGRIVEIIEEQCRTGNNRPPETMAMCGGSVSRGVNIKKASGEELSTTVLFDEANALIWYLSDLVKEAQTPVAENKNWFCQNCGMPNEDSATFCIECGTKRN